MGEVAKGVHRVSGFSNSYIVEQPDGKLTIVDSGFEPDAKKILAELASMGRGPRDVETIVLTHGHQDHSRGAAKLKAATGAKLAAHQSEVEYVSGKKKYPPAKGAMRLFTGILGAFVKVEPAEVELALSGDERLGRLLVVHVPGHTPGSIALLDAETKSVFSGDAVVSGKGGLVGPNRSFTMDIEEGKRSLGKLSTLSFETVLPGHGDPFTAADAPRRVGELA